MTLLKIDSATMQFGGLTAVNQVTFNVNAHEIVSVIGPNGAGKTTLFNMTTGVYTPTSGSIMIKNHSTMRPYSARLFALLFFAAIVSALFLYIVLNVESLWGALFTQHYIYQEPFPWFQLPYFFSEFAQSLDWWSSWGTLLIGGGLGAAIAYTLWHGSRRTPELILTQGLARTFQNIRIFPTMTVLENILVGMHTRLSASVIGDSLKLPKTVAERQRAEISALEILSLVGLKDAAHFPASKLSYGHQRRLEIGRALASQPELVLLDEPAAGMNPSESAELMRLITRLRDKKITILLIEHHMKVVMGISDRIIVLDYGEKIAEGTPSEIRKNPEVIKAYLGGDELAS